MVFENTDYRFEILDLKNRYDVKKMKGILDPLGFDFIAEQVDYTFILTNLNDDFIGTGSLKDNVLKFVAVDPKFRETSAFAIIVSHLTETSLKKNKTSFVFTKPENVIKFKSIGYNEIASAPPIYALLEFGYQTISDYKNYLISNKSSIVSDKIATIVVNCNPFTNGHKYLIEKAAAENDILYLFVVEEDQSVFSFDIRWKLIEEGINHLKNVIMLKGGRYIVSSATFPAYFLKKESIDIITQKQTELDVNVFIKHIIPTLDITRRYVGEEIYCKTTAAYNSAMKEFLGKNNVELIEIPRMSIGSDDNFISASKVRNAIKNGTLNDILDFLPDSTKSFLLSEDSQLIKDKIISSESRH
ncbi:MAG: [citrate (pro-3S)-lyase] ligase [Bacteroidota bacterium]